MARKTAAEFEKECNIIRGYKAAGFNSGQIVDMLKIPKSTYWYYSKVIHDEDRKAYEEHLRVAIPHEIITLKDKLSLLEQRAIELLSQTKEVSEIIEIIRLIKELAIERVQIDYEGPDIIGHNIEQTFDKEIQAKENKYKHN